MIIPIIYLVGLKKNMKPTSHFCCKPRQGYWSLSIIRSSGLWNICLFLFHLHPSWTRWEDPLINSMCLSIPTLLLSVHIHLQKQTEKYMAWMIWINHDQLNNQPVTWMIWPSAICLEYMIRISELLSPRYHIGLKWPVLIVPFTFPQVFLGVHLPHYFHFLFNCFFSGYDLVP